MVGLSADKREVLVDVVLSAGDVDEQMSDAERDQIASTLKDRADGPFVEFDPSDRSFWEGIKERGRAKLEAKRAGRG